MKTVLHKYHSHVLQWTIQWAMYEFIIIGFKIYCWILQMTHFAHISGRGVCQFMDLILVKLVTQSLNNTSNIVKTFNGYTSIF